MQITVSKSKVKNLAVGNALMSATTYETVKDRGVERAFGKDQVREGNLLGVLGRRPGTP